MAMERSPPEGGPAKDESLMVDVCACVEQRPEDVDAATDGGTHKRRSAFLVLQVDVRTPVQQCSDDVGVSEYGGMHKGGPTGIFPLVDVGAFVQQARYLGGVALQRCGYERRQAALITRVNFALAPSQDEIPESLPKRHLATLSTGNLNAGMTAVCQPGTPDATAIRPAGRRHCGSSEQQISPLAWWPGASDKSGRNAWKLRSAGESGRRQPV